MEKGNIKDFKMWICYFVVLPRGTKDLYSLTIMSLINICKGIRPDDLRFYKSLKSSINLSEALFKNKNEEKQPPLQIKVNKCTNNYNNKEQICILTDNITKMLDVQNCLDQIIFKKSALYIHFIRQYKLSFQNFVMITIHDLIISEVRLHF